MQDEDEETQKVFQEVEKQQAIQSQQNSLKKKPKDFSGINAHIQQTNILEGRIDDVQEYNSQRNQERKENLNGKTLKISEIQSHYVNWRLIGLVVAKGPIQTNKQKDKTFLFELEDPDYENIEIQCCHQHFDFIMLGKSYIFSKIYVPQDKNSKFTIMRQIQLKSWSDIKEIPQDKSQILQNYLETLCQVLQTNKIDITKLRYVSQNNFQSVQLKSLFFPNPDDEQTYYRYLQTTEKFLLVCMYSFTSNDILLYLQNMNNVSIKIIVDLEQSNEDSHQRKCLDSLSQFDNIQVRISPCEKNRTSVRTFKYMHNKFVVIDDKTVMTGSLNWSYSAFKSNDENVLIVEDSITSQEYTHNFNKIWEKSTLYFKTKPYVEQLIQSIVDNQQNIIQINQENEDTSNIQIQTTQQINSQKPIPQKINDLNSQTHEILQHQIIQNQIVKKQQLLFKPKLRKPAQFHVIKNGNNQLEDISSVNKKINKQSQKEQMIIQNCLEIQQNLNEPQYLPNLLQIPLEYSEQVDGIQTPQFLGDQQNVDEEMSVVIEEYENNSFNKMMDSDRITFNILGNLEIRQKHNLRNLQDIIVIE